MIFNWVNEDSLSRGNVMDAQWSGRGEPQYEKLVQMTGDETEANNKCYDFYYPKWFSHIFQVNFNFSVCSAKFGARVRIYPDVNKILKRLSRTCMTELLKNEF